jgi:thymidylate synthase (FAD)
MKLINPTVEYIPQGNSLEDAYKHIELCARTCYKSEDRITEDSAKKMIDNLIRDGHTSMLEHGTIYLAMPVETVLPIEANGWGKYYHNPYSDSGTICEVNGERRVAVTTNLRVIVKNHWEDDLKYICEPTPYHKRRYTMKFTCARIDSQSITRYRHNSFAQESQRWCNYFKASFGSSVTFSKPIWIKPEDLEELEEDVKISEKLYFKWLGKGYKPEQARYFLINGTKTEIMVTGFMEDWEHFFDERITGTTGRPSPDMKYLASLALDQFVKNKIIDPELIRW